MTLTELISTVRKTAPFAILGFVLIVIFFLLIQGFLGYLDRQNQQTGPAIDAIYGNLPPLTLKNAVAYPEGASFTLDNIEGRPTTSTNSARVYQIPTYSTRFSFLQTITLMAKAVGFDTTANQYRLEETQAIFENTEQKLTVDITSFNFDFAVNVNTDPAAFRTSQFPKEDRIIEMARGFMTRMGKYTNDLAQGTAVVSYHRYNTQTSEYEQVSEPTEADVAEVDFFKNSQDGIPVVAPEYTYSQNYVVMMFDGEASRVLKAASSQFDPDKNSFGTYPVKTGDVAWEELKSGKGLIVLPGKNTPEITVREMFIAYLDPNIFQPYLMPVYVFLGDNNFVGYVSAIDDQFIESQSGQSP